MSEDILFSSGIVAFHLEMECKDNGLRKFCRKHDLDPGNVSKIINGERPMSQAVAECLGYKHVVRWRKFK